MSKERPILFSAPMVLAILEGWKTQTRRIIKPQPRSIGQTPLTGRMTWSWRASKKQGFNWEDGLSDDRSDFLKSFCPYGVPGDRLWVRESFWRCMDTGRLEWYAADAPDDVEFNKTVAKKPSIHMPREASRITLEIERIRVERLQDISETDATAEGMPRPGEYPLESGRWSDGFPCPKCRGQGVHAAVADNLGVTEVDCVQCDTAAKAFRHIWQAINGNGSWNENPWVWVVCFKRVTP